MENNQQEFSEIKIDEFTIIEIKNVLNYIKDCNFECIFCSGLVWQPV